MKICSKCGLEKNESEYYKKKSCKNGIMNMCKSCFSINQKRPQRLNAQKKYYENNKKKCLDAYKKWATDNPEKVNKNWKTYRDSHKKNRLDSALKARVEMKDWYIKQSLRAKGFTDEIMKQNNNILSVQKIIIKTKRLCKTLQNSEKV
jgi:hypothetical protein